MRFASPLVFSACFGSLLLITGCAETVRQSPVVPSAPPLALVAPLDVSVGDVSYQASNPRRPKDHEDVVDITGVTSRNPFDGTLHLITVPNSSGDHVGTRIVLRDLQGGLLWESGTRYSGDLADSTFVFYEKTQSDSLFIERTVQDGVVTDTYTLNGGDPYQQARPVAATTSATDSLAEALSATFASLGSLAPNDNGTVALGIVADEDFIDWLQEALPPSQKSTSSAQTPQEVKEACSTAGILCAYKCFVWPANPLCLECAILAVVCAVWSLF